MSGAHAGRRIVVMGLGSFGGGVGVARYLARSGARVLATDLRRAEELGPALTALAGLDIEYVLGEHRERDFDAADLVIANPAVAPSHPLLVRTRARGARVSSEMELFLETCPARVIAITGTQGKSSTSALTAQLLERSGFAVELGGNIGRSLLDANDQLRADQVCVIEISSYQLEALNEPGALHARVEAACIVNVLADHLERHGTLEAYRAAKLRILDLLDDGGVAVLPGCDEQLSGAARPGCRRALFWPPEAARRPDRAERALGYHVDQGRFLEGELVLGRSDEFALPGSFQQGNLLAALALARAAGAGADSLRAAIPALRGLEFRVQDLGIRAGHRVIDNGVSTTPDSTIAALIDQREPVVLLCGGKQKQLPLDELVECARSRVALALCFGAAAPALARALRARGVAAEELPDVPSAVARAFERAVEGQAILFSPACASFDAYLNFEQRARHFRSCLPPVDAPQPHAVER